MKNYFLVLVVLSLSLSSLAQETGVKLRHEMGLSMSSLNQFGLVYRVGNEKLVGRLNNLYFFNSSSDLESKNGTVGTSTTSEFNIALGLEFRKELHENFYFRYGADLFHNSSTVNTKESFDDPVTYFTDNNKTTSRGYGLSFVIGFNYEIGEHFIIGAEILPYVGYFINETKGNFNSFTTYTETDVTIDGVESGFSNNAALLSFVYRLN